MLELRNVKKSFSDGRMRIDAVKGVDLCFPERGLFFLVGKSGSGKSTLLNLLGGLNASPVELKASSNGSQYAMRFYFEGGNDGTFSMRTRATDQSTNPVQAWLDAGYTALDISFYAAPLSGNSVGEIQV